MAYSSKSLTATEQCYAQIEKECLAIVEAFNKLDQWLLSKANITVHTDHQPLQSIFQKDLASALKRLQKMMLFLQHYSLAVFYGKGTSLYLPDPLSRALCRESPVASKESDMFQVFRAHISQVDPVSTLVRDTTCAKLCRATAAFSDIQTLEHHIIHGWPPTKQQLPKQLQSFWNCRDEFTIADGLVLKSTRIVPVSLRAETLVKIHQSHRGPEYWLRFAW